MAEAGQAGGLGGQLVAGARGAWARVQTMPAAKRNRAAAVAALVLAVIAGFSWWAGRPQWRTLFDGLEGRDMQQVIQELAAAGIRYQTTADGASVEVPAEQLDKARMEVATKGMPQTGRLGFELFDKPNWMGSEFDEKVNYQRALEGELEHTIGSMGEVRSARVHLALAQESLFASEEKPAKASVVLRLRRSSLTEDQADSIRSLVAGAVEDLSPEKVMLVDADGRTNLQAHGGGGTEAEEEQALQQKLVSMLEPLAGVGNVRASVTVSHVLGNEERTDEIYDPAQEVTLTMQRREQTTPATMRAQGVPGTASNTPAAAVQGAVQGSERAAAPGAAALAPQAKDGLPVYPQAGGAGQSMKEENGTYGVTKHTVHMEEGPGRVRRVTAAVVVNDRRVVEGNGKQEKTAWRPRTSEEMHRLEQLAQAAVGFDEKRGDSVVLENVSFSSNGPDAAPSATARAMETAQELARTQPGLARSLVIGALGLLVVMLFVRPVTKQLVTMMREPAMLPARGVVMALPEGKASEDKAEAREQELPAARGVRPLLGHAVYEQVSEHIRRDPTQSTRVLESWIAHGEEVA